MSTPEKPCKTNLRLIYSTNVLFWEGEIAGDFWIGGEIGFKLFITLRGEQVRETHSYDLSRTSPSPASPWGENLFINGRNLTDFESGG